MKKIVWVILGIGFVIAIVTLNESHGICSWDFRGSLWGPSYMLLHGQTPYSTNTPYGPYPGIWMPHLIGAFLPIGWLPCWVAANIWFVSELVSLLLIVWLVAGSKLPSPKLFGLSLVMIFMFPPLYFHFIIGQISIFITVLIMLVIFDPNNKYPTKILPWWMSLFLALALAKPQLGVLVYPGLLVKMYDKHGKRGAINLILHTAGWVALLIIPITLIDPYWWKGFFEIIFENINVQWNLPTLYVQLRLSLGLLGSALWFMIFLTSLGLVLWLWLKRNPQIALLWTLALTPIATPYSSSWDFILLLPLMIWLLLNTRFIMPRVVLVVGILLIDILQVAMRWQKSGIPDGDNWWVPLSVLAIFLLTKGLGSFYSKRSKVHN